MFVCFGPNLGNIDVPHKNNIPMLKALLYNYATI